ncbi:hypothetical protein [Bacillus safensis]|uniref:hypothetical protein n=1 Tax=Bacillus safensis TaxID=561879 RepID=UPI002452A452|nr:hypothetical protein [Bacillus safensis]MDH3095577.1 hypothetical protein [Bacillus safensis]
MSDKKKKTESVSPRVGIAGYEIKQKRISENPTEYPKSTLNVEFLFINGDSSAEKFDKFLKDLAVFIDERNEKGV